MAGELKKAVDKVLNSFGDGKNMEVISKKRDISQVTIVLLAIWDTLEMEVRNLRSVESIVDRKIEDIWRLGGNGAKFGAFLKSVNKRVNRTLPPSQKFKMDLTIGGPYKSTMTVRAMVTAIVKEIRK